MAITDDYGEARGWFSGFAGERLVSGHQLAPMLKIWRTMAELGPYEELRAWVAAEEPVSNAFAKRCGFRLDCRATGFGPTGRDMNLMIWRRGYGHFQRQRRRR
jgi:hypothetical protein